MSNIFKGNVLLVGGLLVGYCLAYPVTLATYFYEKPQIDLVVYGLLFVASFCIFWRFLSKKSWFKGLAISLLILPLTWLKLEYWLYSELSSPQFVTYTLLIILAMAMASVLRYKILPQDPRWVKLMAIPTAVIGFVISYFSKEHSVIELFMLFFGLGLASQYWKSSRAGSVSLIIFSFLLTVSTVFLEEPEFFERQTKYHDKVVFSKTTDLQVIDVTEWRGNHWFYADGVNQFSSIDSWLFYEPFVFPALELAKSAEDILVIGGENGMLVNQLRKAGIQNVKLKAMDQELLKMAQNETLFIENNANSLSNTSIEFIQEDVFSMLNRETERFDLIFVDVADPIDLERNQYFTQEFYQLIRGSLKSDGLFITQSGSPYFATGAFEVVQKTIRSAGFDPLAFHNQILTLGEWSWTIGAINRTSEELKAELSNTSFAKYQTQWLNQEGMQMMLSFGKPTRVSIDLKLNTMKDPVLYQYYLNGNYTLK
ncbi:MAG: putative membrane-bound spermidine synthase [Roseivirga sp.]|jgi:predicted membrane-bound spermidine synthase